MPTSRTRPKKAQNQERKPVIHNPLKKRWGRIVVLILVVGFLLGTVAGTIFLLFEFFRNM